MKNKLKHKDWRTTIGGIIVSFAMVGIPYLEDKEFNIENVIFAIIIAIAGFLAKDEWIGYGNKTEEKPKV